MLLPATSADPSGEFFEMIRHLILLGCLALGVAACAGPQALGGSTSITVINANEMPAPDGGPPSQSSVIYTVGGRDKLAIDVYGIEELKDRQFETDIGGGLALPIAGRIEAYGLTLAELEAAIGRKLEQAFVRFPQVSVNPVDVRSQRVTVEGSVREPGLFPLIGDMTLMQAIAQAKGTSEFARLEDVVVFRDVQGQRMVALYNLGGIRRGAYADPRIFPGDIIIVGESSGRRLFDTVVQAGALITAPLIALVNQN